MIKEQLKDANEILNQMGMENAQEILVIKYGATNEEVLKALFKGRIYNALKDRMQHTSWWNALYKKEGEQETSDDMEKEGGYDGEVQNTK